LIAKNRNKNFYKSSVLSISWKRDMTMIFAALADNTVRVYDIKTG